jgi:ubiquinone/menaquinone biosynthesis C-methylase UbiE
LIRQSDYENYDYRQFWQDDKRLYEDSAERLVIKKFISSIKNKDSVFIDLGCGFGRLFNEYKDFSRIIMVDYSINNLKNAKEIINKFLKNDEKLLSKVIFIAADVTNLPLKSSIADNAVTVRVIHHIENPGKYFTETGRIIKPGGIFMLEFANKRNLKNILRFLSGRIRQSPFSIEPLQVGPTILDYHPRYIMSLLDKAGFKVQKMISASNFRLGFLKRHIKLKTLLFFESFYQNIFSFINTGPSIFLKTINTSTVEPKTHLQKLPVSNKTSIVTRDPLDFFICPACGGENITSLPSGNIECKKCQNQYPVIEGIFNFKS